MDINDRATEHRNVYQNKITQLEGSLIEMKQVYTQGKQFMFMLNPDAYEQHQLQLKEKIAKYNDLISRLDSLINLPAAELSDGQLRIINSNDRVNLEEDPLYLASSPDLQVRFKQRDLSEADYNGLWANIFPEPPQEESTAIVPAAAPPETLTRIEKSMKLYAERLGYTTETLRELADIAETHHTNLAHLVNRFMLEEVDLEDIAKIFELKQEYCFTVNADSAPDELKSKRYAVSDTELVKAYRLLGGADNLEKALIALNDNLSSIPSEHVMSQRDIRKLERGRGLITNRLLESFLRTYTSLQEKGIAFPIETAIEFITGELNPLIDSDGDLYDQDQE